MGLNISLAVSRAEGWLGDALTWLDRDFEVCEAAIYFASRGTLDPKWRRLLTDGWHRFEQGRSDAQLHQIRAADAILTALANNTNGRKAEKNKPAPPQIEAIPDPCAIADWWRQWVSDDAQPLITESMIRATEWLNVSDFDGWWAKCAHEYDDVPVAWNSNVLQAWWLFNVTRSGRCLSLWAHRLPGYLATASAMHIISPAWNCAGFRRRFDSVLACAALLFATTRVDTGEASRKLQRDGFEFLYGSQHESGAFPAFTGGKPDTNATAIAIHALREGYAAPSALRAECAAQYLLDCQDEAGHWDNSPYTTVLVLDALALVTDGIATSITSKPAYAAMGHFAVELRGRLVEPLVHGRATDILTDAEYDVIEMMIRAGRPLKKDQLLSGRGNAVNTLKKLAEREPWDKVIYLPGTKKNGYALKGTCKTHT